MELSFSGPLSERTAPLARHVTDRVRGWVRYVLDLDDEVAVLVTQLACRDAGCSPVETVLAVLHPGAPQSRTFAGPAGELCASDVVEQGRPPSAILPASSSGAPFMTTRSTSGKQDLEGRRRRRSIRQRHRRRSPAEAAPPPDCCVRMRTQARRRAVPR